MSRNKRIEAVTVPRTDFNQVLGQSAQGVPQLAGAAAGANISQGIRGTQAGLQLLQTQGLRLTNPAAADAIARYTRQNPVTSQMLTRQQTLTDRVGTIQGYLNSGTGPNGRPLTAAQRATYNKQLQTTQKDLTKLTNTITQRQGRVEAFTNQQLAANTPAGDVMREADPEFYRNVDRAQQVADTIGQVTPEGQRFLDAAAQGFQAQAITSRDVERGALGDSLMARAQAGIDRGGRLSPEAARDAVQAARQGFAARGMGTGSASAAAELLNRDRFARAREFEDLTFAGGVQQQDVARQMGNVDRSLNAAIQNEQARRMGAVTNNEMLYNAAGYRDALRGQALGASLQMAGVQQQANPLMRAIGFDPFQTRGLGAQSLGPSTQLASNVAQLNSSADQFNANAQMWANSANMFRPSFGGGGGGGAMAGLLGGLGGAALGAAGVALAPATFGTSLLPAMAGGFGLGAGVGGMMGGR